MYDTCILWGRKRQNNRRSGYGGARGGQRHARFACAVLKPEQSSERSLLRTMENITLFPCPQKVRFTFEMRPQELAAAKAYYRDFFERAVRPEQQTRYDMLILDEVFSLCDCGILEEETLFSFLCGYHGQAELVLTGHTVPARCIAMCDYASHIKKVRHPFDHGAAARRGIEF